MKKQVKVVVAIVVAVLVGCAAWMLFRAPESGVGTPDAKGDGAKKPQIADVARPADAVQPDAGGDAAGSKTDGTNPDEGASEEDDDERSEEEKRAEEEEALVNAFDDMTDKFMDGETKKAVTMDDVKAFHDQFRKVPKERKEECLHRALNLLPDSSIMLLAGILMDKEEDKELVELVFNDVLNRDEEVKMVLLKEIFKDKTHPCWADTAWILDVTDQIKE